MSRQGVMRPTLHVTCRRDRRRRLQWLLVASAQNNAVTGCPIKGTSSNTGGTIQVLHSEKRYREHQLYRSAKRYRSGVALHHLRLAQPSAYNLLAQALSTTTAGNFKIDDFSILGTEAFHGSTSAASTTLLTAMAIPLVSLVTSPRPSRRSTFVTSALPTNLWVRLHQHEGRELQGALGDQVCLPHRCF